MNFIARQGRALLLTAVLVVGLSGCGGGDNPSALVGQWVSMNGGESVELFKDGTGVIDKTSLTWKIMDKNRFVLSYDDDTYVSDYNLSGYELTRTFEDGKVIVWVRKDKVEEYKKKKEEEKKKEQERMKKETEQRFEKVSSYFTDSRNGQKYRSVKIGGKTWMAENLNYQTGNSWCFGDDNSNCEKYGRLYDWNTAMTACPSGWHLPSLEEWNDLLKESGGNVAGKALKSTYGWDSNGNGVYEFGFSALPGGCRYTDGSFGHVGEVGFWWTAAKNGGGPNAYFRFMNYDKDYVNESDFGKGNGYSVRCLQDN
jgi:uncharacterized protein (TIGR02145 family)